MERVPDDYVLWRGQWESKKYPTIVAHGIIVVLLKKPYNKAQQYNTRAFVIYQGGYRKNGRITVPVEVEVKLNDIVGKPEKSQHVNYKFDGKYNGQDICYKVTRFENGEIQGKYSTSGEQEDNGTFYIKETDEREVNTKESYGCLVM